MSSDTDADAAAMAALFNRFYTEGYLRLAVTTFFIYDALITFDREVACFWTAKWNGAPLLYFTNKWISLTLYVLSLGASATFPSDKVCSNYEIAISSLTRVQFIPGAVFSALRAYVLSRSKFLGLLVLALSLAPFGANLAAYHYDVSGVNFPPFGCLYTDNTDVPISLKVVLISRVPLIVADSLLVYITWTKLRSQHLLRDIRHAKRLSLSDVLFRGGTIYFAVLSILNIVHLVISATALEGFAQGSYIPIFTAPLTAIFISRFLLELQEANQAAVKGVDLDDPLHSSGDPYDSAPSFISSLGGFINPDAAPRDEDTEWDVDLRSGGLGEEEEGGVQTPKSPSEVAASASSA
ncbi:hypothetical protein L227DRAFT_654449 [Lentinus tigrinus ALCF2SS1-6]|uniref:DUF6533 domain-containing protein n=1 Tax=Lentinus tigrinus ALCF2SS1-6 TaxID=1328759 RepID=A0A5C2S700_9APHY|nr:hypothetical protein L227DRAFT_654449 [Lentinus tigrinus ALCF2SS1-6]